MHDDERRITRTAPLHYSNAENETVVVGASFSGLVIAEKLAKDGHRVRLFDVYAEVSRGPDRSELVYGEALAAIGLRDALGHPITHIEIFSLDSGERFRGGVFEDGVPHDAALSSLPLMVFDHPKGMQILFDRTTSNTNVTFEQRARVERLKDSSDGYAAEVTAKGITQRVRAAVNATGPTSSLPFSNPRRQAQWERSIVAHAYGKRIEGTLNLPLGERLVALPVSKVTGEMSWVHQYDDRHVDVVACGYSTRSKVSFDNGPERYEQLEERLIKDGVITKTGNGKIIAGVFGLSSPKLAPSGDEHVFNFGERGQYSGANGDTIYRTIVLAPDLSRAIGQGQKASEFERRVQKQYGSRLEHAATMARVNSDTVGNGLGLFNATNSLDHAGKTRFLRDHKVPMLLMVKHIATHPRQLVPVALDIASEYAKSFFPEV